MKAPAAKAGVKPVVYDSGALIAADRSERSFWAEHRARLEMSIVPIVPAPVVAQVSRSARQVQLRRLLVGCEVVDFTEADGHAAGALLAKSKTNDIVDAAVVTLAVSRDADVVTGDARDIARLAAAAGARFHVFDVSKPRR